MYRVLVVAAVAAICCVGLVWGRPDTGDLAWRRPAASDWVTKILRERLCWLGWRVGLLAMALSLIALPGGNPRPPAYLAAAATALLVLCAPPAARRLAPFVLVGIGLLGIALALSTTFPPSAGLGWVLPRPAAWRASLVLQPGVFLAVGLWLLWRARESRLGRPALSRPPRWGLLLPPAAGIAVLLVDQGGRHPAWIAAAAAALIALIAVTLLPAAAPDLAAAGVTVLGLCALAYVVSPPDTAVHALTVSPSSPPHSIVLGITVSGPLELLAAVEAAAILALGLWLVPRTIGVHARALLLRPGPDPELAGRVRQLTQTRADALDTAAAELRRVERDLHDGAQARLVALGMSLRAAERLIPTSPQAAIALVAEAREDSSRALTELRDLVRGVYPPVLADRGLADAVRALALDTPIRTETDISLPGRLDPPVESACFFAVAEALTNAVKHSGARLVQVRIRYSAGPHSPAYLSRPARSSRPAPGMLRIEVTDDGTGGADPAKGSGLAGVERRLGTFDGILAVSSPPGGPTMIVMEIPCALSSRRTSSY
jgi:signal transduction histidine kinase